MRQNLHSNLFSEAIKLSSSVVHDKAKESACVIKGLSNHTRSLIMVGKAYPVKTEGNILPVLQALEFLGPHDILVIEDSVKEQALLGDIVLLGLAKIGVKGVVCDGCVRDIDHAERIGVSVWSRSVTPAAAGLGKSALPVSTVTIADSPIHKGDWLFGDGDGLVSIPRGQARFIIKAASIKNKREKIYKRRIENGEVLYQMMNIDGHLQRNEDIVVEF